MDLLDMVGSFVLFFIHDAQDIIYYATQHRAAFYPDEAHWC